MHTLKKTLHHSITQFFASRSLTLIPSEIVLQKTKPEFEGEITFVLFGICKKYRLPLEENAQSLGLFLKKEVPHIIAHFQLIKGFLNFSIQPQYYLNFLEKNYRCDTLKKTPDDNRILVEYSSPNTNKPLHLGHLRNNFLGYTMSKIYAYNGYQVQSVCVVNDRGIHICKSMLAYKKWGDGATPESAGRKPDHFVGDYYVRFAQALKEETQRRHCNEDDTELMQEARALLREWENGNPEVRALWQKMNEWVYAGFKQTYREIGTSFDKIYYESDLYLLGKDLVLQGVKDGVFYQKEDGSIWIKIKENDEKVLLRSDGTSVYMTQDIALALKKYDEFSYDRSIYVVGNEQDYHFQTLQVILDRMHIPQNVSHIHHLSYGMVELTEGKMKSREGNVVDADDLIARMVAQAERYAEESGKVKDIPKADQEMLYRNIALAALKFFLLKVDARKRIVFNPQESIDFQGFTGPFIQYTYVRIHSILEKYTRLYGKDALCSLAPFGDTQLSLSSEEKVLLILLTELEEQLLDAQRHHNPAIIAQYIYSVAQSFNTFYATAPILKESDKARQALRLKITLLSQKILQAGADILGIPLNEKM